MSVIGRHLVNFSLRCDRHSRSPTALYQPLVVVVTTFLPAGSLASSVFSNISASVVHHRVLFPLVQQHPDFEKFVSTLRLRLTSKMPKMALVPTR